MQCEKCKCTFKIHSSAFCLVHQQLTTINCSTGCNEGENAPQLLMLCKHFPGFPKFLCWGETSIPLILQSILPAFDRLIWNNGGMIVGRGNWTCAKKMLPHCPPQILNGLPWHRNWMFMLGS